MQGKFSPRVSVPTSSISYTHRQGSDEWRMAGRLLVAKAARHFCTIYDELGEFENTMITAISENKHPRYVCKKRIIRGVFLAGHDEGGRSTTKSDGTEISLSCSGLTRQGHRLSMSGTTTPHYAARAGDMYLVSSQSPRSSAVVSDANMTRDDLERMPALFRCTYCNPSSTQQQTAHR